MRTFSRSPVSADVRTVWASGETKAIEAAGIPAVVLGLDVQVSRDIGENDRSATGCLSPTEFEAVADAFFSDQGARSEVGSERLMPKPASARPCSRLRLPRKWQEHSILIRCVEGAPPTSAIGVFLLHSR